NAALDNMLRQYARLRWPTSDKIHRRRADVAASAIRYGHSGHRAGRDLRSRSGAATPTAAAEVHQRRTRVAGTLVFHRHLGDNAADDMCRLYDGFGFVNPTTRETHRQITSSGVGYVHAGYGPLCHSAIGASNDH